MSLPYYTKSEILPLILQLLSDNEYDPQQIITNITSQIVGVDKYIEYDSENSCINILFEDGTTSLTYNPAEFKFKDSSSQNDLCIINPGGLFLYNSSGQPIGSINPSSLSLMDSSNNQMFSVNPGGIYYYYNNNALFNVTSSGINYFSDNVPILQFSSGGNFTLRNSNGNKFLDVIGTGLLNLSDNDGNQLFSVGYSGISYNNYNGEQSFYLSSGGETLSVPKVNYFNIGANISISQSFFSSNYMMIGNNQLLLFKDNDQNQLMFGVLHNGILKLSQYDESQENSELEVGDFIFSSSDNKFKYYDGTEWLTFIDEKYINENYNKKGVIEPKGVYEDNASAISGGLQTNDVYRTSDGTLKIVY